MSIQFVDNLPEKTHDALLLHLKREGELTVAQLCQKLSITSMAVRRHLMGLQQEGLVGCRIVKQNRGRPTYHYHLTEKATNQFPSGFQALAMDLLDTVNEISGSDGVRQILEQRNNRLYEQLKSRLENKSLKEKVIEVTKFFAENGYMSEWEELPDGNFLIYQRHCAVHSLANQYRQLCALEPLLIERMLGNKVKRQQYIMKDDPVCAYLIEA